MVVSASAHIAPYSKLASGCTVYRSVEPIPYPHAGISPLRFRADSTYQPNKEHGGPSIVKAGTMSGKEDIMKFVRIGFHAIAVNEPS